MTNVLVIDDALTIRKYHRTLLEEIGCNVIEAENGLEALETLYEQDISLCLVDVNMPHMDGFTFVSEVRKGNEQADCPIIMITTESKKEEMEKASKVGVNFFLVKPAAPEVLQNYCQMLIGS